MGYSEPRSNSAKQMVPHIVPDIICASCRLLPSFTECFSWPPPYLDSSLPSPPRLLPYPSRTQSIVHGSPAQMAYMPPSFTYFSLLPPPFIQTALFDPSLTDSSPYPPPLHTHTHYSFFPPFLMPRSTQTATSHGP